MDNRKVLLSVKDLHVKFRVRGRILTAIRGVSLDLYEGESIAIVGESGSGKSVFTKTFAGMLDSNGFISRGSIIFNDDEISKTNVTLTSSAKSAIKHAAEKLNAYSVYEFGSDIYNKIGALKKENEARYNLPDSDKKEFEDKLKDLKFKRTETFNEKQTVDPKNEKQRLKDLTARIADFDKKILDLENDFKNKVNLRKKAAAGDVQYNSKYKTQLSELEASYKLAINKPVSKNTIARNLVIAKEIYLSVGRYGTTKRNKYIRALLREFRLAMKQGLDLNSDAVLNSIFDKVVFRVQLIAESETELKGNCVLNLAQVKYSKDWTQIRGSRIATVFQDPMTSLNPIITIGKQITSVILKHQKCSEVEARRRALELMKKVGIPNAEKRFDDYPFQYSGGMRQRIVIAIALSCQPKILICDEPTTALDVTIQAQILKLIKDLQKEFGYTIVFITHDLGVVANIADRVAVLYAGQMIEVGKVEEVFYDPRHPYTWALLSSLPQLAERNTKLYSISGTPPSLYNEIVGDAFAPRNPYCLKVDTLKEPPMFPVTETHFAKTWLLDPRAPKVNKPEIIEDIHEKLLRSFNI